MAACSTAEGRYSAPSLKNGSNLHLNMRKKPRKRDKWTVKECLQQTSLVVADEKAMDAILPAKQSTDYVPKCSHADATSSIGHSFTEGSSIGIKHSRQPPAPVLSISGRNNFAKY